MSDDSPPTSPHQPSKNEQDFVRVVKVATALGLGLMAAFLYSIKQVHPSLLLEFGFGALAAFVVTAVFTWIFCGVLFRSEFSGDSSGSHAGPSAALRQRRVRRWLIFFLSVCALTTAGSFLYALKDVTSESRREVMEGTAIAVGVLTVGGFLIHKSVRFFEEQDRAQLQMEEEDRQARQDLHAEEEEE